MGGGGGVEVKSSESAQLECLNGEMELICGIFVGEVLLLSRLETVSLTFKVDLDVNSILIDLLVLLFSTSSSPF